MQFGVVALEKTVADNFPVFFVEKTVVAPSMQSCEQFCIRNVWKRAHQVSKFAIRARIAAPPANVRSRFCYVVFV